MAKKVKIYKKKCPKCKVVMIIDYLAKKCPSCGASIRVTKKDMTG